MNLWLRLLFTLLVSWRRPRCGMGDLCFTPYRVLPTDLDNAGHVNNGVYLTLLDLARLDLLIRARKLGSMRKRGWYPVVAAETIQFHRALWLFERFEVETQLIGWDDRTFFIRHRMFRGHARREVVADAIVRGLMARREGGTVPTTELIEAFGSPAPPAPLPQWVLDWARAMDANREQHKREQAARRA